jgi:biotin/methionine sulfoxide reductase
VNKDVRRYRTATQWGVYDLEVGDNSIVGVTGIDADPNPAPMGDLLLDGVQHHTRIQRPAIRKSWLERKDRGRDRRGAEAFVDVPWDEALELAAGELQRVKENYGNRAIFAGSYGWASAGRFHHAQSQLHRFLNLMGGCTRAMNSYSTAAAQVILPHVVAPWSHMELHQTSWQDVIEHSRLVVAFGGLPLRNTQVAYGGITEHNSARDMQLANERGVTFCNISPLQEDVPAWLNAQTIMPRPGTDVALMLGLAYVLEQESLLDREFLRTHCMGYERFREYLLGHSDGVAKTPDWAAQIADVDPTELVLLAHRMAAERTFITAAWSLQRADHGEQPYWMVVTLAAMLGQIGLPGGGFGFGYAAEGFIGSNHRRFNWATLSKGRNPASFAIPVARIADMLLHPGLEIDYDGQKITYPDTRLIYWAGGNPFHHHQDLNRLVRAWRKPDTVIVNEPWWTPTAQWADIVFPATTAQEREDLCASSHDNYAHFMQQVLPVQGQARSDHEIFAGLAAQLGFHDAFTEGRTEREWLQKLWQDSQPRAIQQGFELPDFDEFVAAGQYKLPPRARREYWLADFRADPKAQPLATPSGKLELYSQRIESFAYDDCPAHAAWLEPYEWLGGEQAGAYPLHLLSPQPSRRLHSQLDQSAYSQAGKIAGKEVLSMHPQAAADRGITEGDIVRVYNERGACLAGVRLDAGMRADVVTLPTGAWFRPSDPESEHSLELNGNPNVLTRDHGTSKLAQGPSAHTCLVEVALQDTEAL